MPYPLEDHDSLRNGAAMSLDGLALVELTGDDRLEWLQGQATNDVRGLIEGARLSFCFCEPTGGLLAVVDAWALGDRLVMAVARERVPAVLERVERMTILEDVMARELPLVGVSIQGSSAPDDLAEVLVLQNGFGGWDIWTPTPIDLFPRLDPEETEAVRIGRGIPKWGADMGTRTLPPELGPAFEGRHVSYAKGCYVGQEVLMRMHSRGHTNKTWVGLVARLPLAVGAEVLHEGERVGTVGSASGILGAATLRNEAATEGTVVTAGGVEAEVRAMPLLRAA